MATGCERFFEDFDFVAGFVGTPLGVNRRRVFRDNRARFGFVAARLRLRRLSARDLRRVRIPAAYRSGALLSAADANAVKSAFIKANPGLSFYGMTTVVSRGILTEIDICLTKSGNFRRC